MDYTEAEKKMLAALPERAWHTGEIECDGCCMDYKHTRITAIVENNGDTSFFCEECKPEADEDETEIEMIHFDL